jgi:hypothetical protein
MWQVQVLLRDKAIDEVQVAAYLLPRQGPLAGWEVGVREVMEEAVGRGMVEEVKEVGRVVEAEEVRVVVEVGMEEAREVVGEAVRVVAGAQVGAGGLEAEVERVEKVEVMAMRREVMGKEVEKVAEVEVMEGVEGVVMVGVAGVMEAGH